MRMTTSETMSGTEVNRTGLLNADAIKGRRVINRADEDVGAVDQLYIDAEEHAVRYVTVDIGGFLGIGTKTILVPFERLQWSGADLYLDVDDAMIQDAPEFEPHMAHDREYEAHVGWAWDIAPYWEATGYALDHRHQREQR
jgi:sporulation protein YlmC with PRC-barrel domain